MKKKRKKSAATTDSAEPTIAPAPEIGTSLKGAIATWKQQEGTRATSATKPTPSAARAQSPMTLAPPGPSRPLPVTVPPLPPLPPKLAAAARLSKEDQNALERAFAGVQPLTERKRGGPSATVIQARTLTRQNDAEARARLAALVGGAVRIHVERQEEFVSGLRDGVAKTVLRRLRGESVRAEATLDLHGERASDVAALVNKFVRLQHKKGLRVLLIIHGKGHHSELGVGVLSDHVIATLSKGGAAPLVAAFTNPHESHGGTGALMVELIHG